MPNIRIHLLLLLPMALLGAGCGGGETPSVTLATTTSTRDSGLLDVLLPMFRERTGIEVKVVAVGSGQALQLGRKGDADVILSHAPELEERFMAEGFGESRRALMHNDFVLVGPSTDPAQVRGVASIAEAFRRIAERGSSFISRGDDSGTHAKERLVWKSSKIEPNGDWYVRAGSGMAQVLRMADQERAYTLADRATFLSQRDSLELVILGEGDPLLENRYHVIVVNSEAHPGVHVREARLFDEFLRGDEARRAISSFGAGRFGQALFVPDRPDEVR
ncbi:substrate-binding domain-containing protein [Tundrisphaera lichenicola]|uniref:substrate-binding domain-containing protein n=1 Tax=Tundrisphaera lichenicola TaxID=2029860 RepID=UPI003EBF6B78